MTEDKSTKDFKDFKAVAPISIGKANYSPAPAKPTAATPAESKNLNSSRSNIYRTDGGTGYGSK
jgi:hypothetical protein